jgi:hypothetical protein
MNAGTSLTLLLFGNRLSVVVKDGMLRMMSERSCGIDLWGASYVAGKVRKWMRCHVFKA